MKNFIKTIRSSVYDPHFYKSLEAKKTSSAFSYFIKLNIIVALIFSLGISLAFVPLALIVTNEANMNKVTQFFPQELEIQINKGQAYSNISGPYSIPINSKMIGDKQGKFENKKLITIDTTNDFSLDRFESSNSIAYLSKDYLAYVEKNGQINIQPLKGLWDMTISRTSINSWISSVIPYIRALIPLAIVGLILMSFASVFIGNIIFTLIASLIVFTIESIRKNKIEFNLIFKRALHVVTAVILLDLVLFVFHFGAIWLVNIILFLWLYYSNTKAVSK